MRQKMRGRTFLLSGVRSRTLHPEKWKGGIYAYNKGVGRFQYPVIHHGDTGGTEKSLEFLWNFSVISVPPW